MSDVLTSNIGEFKASIDKIATAFPLESEKRLTRVGNKMKKMLKTASPDSGRAHRRKLNKSWKSKAKGYSGETLSVEIWSTAPHFHLVDRGHKVVNPKGVPIGFVQGKHFLEKTAQEVEATVVPGEMDKFLDEIAKQMG